MSRSRVAAQVEAIAADGPPPAAPGLLAAAAVVESWETHKRALLRAGRSFWLQEMKGAERRCREDLAAAGDRAAVGDTRDASSSPSTPAAPHIGAGDQFWTRRRGDASLPGAHVAAADAAARPPLAPAPQPPAVAPPLAATALSAWGPALSPNSAGTVSPSASPNRMNAADAAALVGGLAALAALPDDSCGVFVPSGASDGPAAHPAEEASSPERPYDALGSPREPPAGAFPPARSASPVQRGHRAVSASLSAERHAAAGDAPRFAAAPMGGQAPALVAAPRSAAQAEESGYEASLEMQPQGGDGREFRRG